jgi:hypothetical protein
VSDDAAIGHVATVGDFHVHVVDFVFAATTTSELDAEASTPCVSLSVFEMSPNCRPVTVTVMAKLERSLVTDKPLLS